MIARKTPPTCYKVVFPSAKGMELILLGGINPTSVTTTVIHVGGVRSYRGLRISRFGVGGRSFVFCFVSEILAGAAYKDWPSTSSTKMASAYRVHSSQTHPA